MTNAELVTLAAKMYTYDHATNRLLSKKTMQPAGGKNNGYLYAPLNKKTVGAHRITWMVVYGEYPENTVDHINGDKSDNNISNLRHVTQATNQQNRRVRSRNNTTGFLGVTAHRNKFRATIWADGKNLHVGMFGTPEEAHAAYLAKKRELHEGCTI